MQEMNMQACVSCTQIMVCNTILQMYLGEHDKVSLTFLCSDLQSSSSPYYVTDKDSLFTNRAILVCHDRVSLTFNCSDLQSSSLPYYVTDKDSLFANRAILISHSCSFISDNSKAHFPHWFPPFCSNGNACYPHWFTPFLQ